MAELTITEFVRGLALHDIGKPFALQGWRHARLGYWLLALTGHSAEALVALRHDEDVRNEYFRALGGNADVPAVTMLAVPLDVLAAAVYALLPAPGRIDHLCHALQNPFTRLPVTPALLQRPLLADGDEALRQVEQDLWEAVTRSLPASWSQTLTSQAKAAAEESLLTGVNPLPGGSDALTRLATALAAFPERTYPPMNDTTLRQHGRLTGILGYVVYRNLERDRQDYLQRSLRQATDAGRLPQADQLVQEHLQACLVRVAWEGLRQWFHQAARVDDMIGTLEMTIRLRQFFKEALAAALQVPDLAEWLTISESQFEMFYLLPNTAGELSALFSKAYAQAIERLAAAVIAERLQRDFPNTAQYQAVLGRQLAALALGLRVVPVTVPTRGEYKHFAVEYGRNLLQAYRDSQDHVGMVLSAQHAAALPEHIATAETCDVCGIHPVWQPPEELDEAGRAAWLSRRDYAAHIFRGEREQICISCAARREMAFGAIARRMDAVVHPMLRRSERAGLWHAVQPERGPALPPLLNAVVDLGQQRNQPDEQPLELVDAGAFYVRYRRTAGGADRSDVDIFPTVSYAADRNGNVVLLTLTPQKEALFGSYDYGQALGTYQAQPAGTGTADEANWQRAVAAFYQAHKEGNEAERNVAAAMHTVEPHTARVMERIEAIRRFYAALEMSLASEEPQPGRRPLRVLPLNVEFPTLRLLFPADRLDDALRILDRVVTQVLFSATYCEEAAQRQAVHNLLRLVTPDLFHGAVILFKHKFPLYLALEAERNIVGQLQTAYGLTGKAGQAPRSEGYGFRLGFSDLRGTLSEVGPLDAVVTYGQLGAVLDLVARIDRPTLLQYAETRQYSGAELAHAQAVVRANRLSRTQVRYVQQLQDAALFDAVYFITRAIRR